MKSITMVTCRVRAWASAVIRSIWWLLPSTRATQVRSWSGSRRSASTLAVSHLFDVTGPGWIWARSVSSTGRMSALVRGADILPVDDTERAQIHPGPVTSNKWLTASVVADAAAVVAQIFAEADRRDPDHDRTWVALVDGNNHQIDRITAEAHARTLQVTIVIDFIHVLEYIWKAAWCFHREGDPAAEEWVRH